MGVIDLLCVIPHAEVVKYGIPFVRSLIEEGLDKNDIEKWDHFWAYFIRQWANKTDTFTNGALSTWMALWWTWSIAQTTHLKITIGFWRSIPQQAGTYLNYYLIPFFYLVVLKHFLVPSDIA